MSDGPEQAGFDPREFLRTLSTRPGVYRMLDARGDVLYVGKARNLRRRVASYFGRKGLDAKTQALLHAVAHIEVTVTATEQEALLLEYNLIKEHRPRFNVVLRDDKSYPYIRVTTRHPFPRFEFHRGSRGGGERFIGPFPDAGAVRHVLQQLQKLFCLRNCTDIFFANRSRPCLQYQIGRCSGPCVGLISETEYRRDVDDAIRFVEGQDQAVVAELVARMERCADEMEFERAARYRDQIADLRRVQEQQIVSATDATDTDAVAMARQEGQCAVALLMIRAGRVLGCRVFFPRNAADTAEDEVLNAFLVQHYLAHVAPAEILIRGSVADAAVLEQALAEFARHPVALRQRVRGTRRRWVDMALTNARQAAASRAAATATLAEQFAELARSLQLSTSPERIECFDISHTQGGETVASCVVYRVSGPQKGEYRRFNVRDVEPGDDYAAIGQAVRRRYARVASGELAPPDLVLIDGGRGQLSRAAEVLGELGLTSLPLVAVAKGAGRRPGTERLYRHGHDRPLGLEPGSPGLRLVQQIRDEAHRFAITGHRARRSRARSGSALESIPGLGPKRRKALLQHFGGLQGVARAGVADLERVAGISRSLAERVYGEFHDTVASEG
jgi:excinuclease ABC subunit C